MFKVIMFLSYIIKHDGWSLLRKLTLMGSRRKKVGEGERGEKEGKLLYFL